MTRPEPDWNSHAEADMRRLGFDPSSPDDWRQYAIHCYRHTRLVGGIEKHGEPDILLVERNNYEKICQSAATFGALVNELRRIEKQYLDLAKQDQRDVLKHAVRTLEFISDLLRRCKISSLGGLPTPCQILIPEMLDVLDNRQSRLLSPSDQVVAGAREVSDSSQANIRMTIQAYAAAAVHQIIKSKKFSRQTQVYKAVADALRDAGLLAPGKRKARPYSASTIRDWYEKCLTEKNHRALRYNQGLMVTPDDPDIALDLLATHARSLQFARRA